MYIDIKHTGDRLLAGETVTVYERDASNIDVEVTLDGPGGPGFWFNVGEPGVDTHSAWIPLGEHNDLWSILAQAAAALDYARRVKELTT